MAKDHIDFEFKLFDFRGCYVKDDLTIMYPYPGGIFCETRPYEGQIHTEFGNDGYPKFVHKYQNGVGNGWVDITATYCLGDSPSIEKGCICGSKNPIGQGHSNWCKLFKQEF